MRRNSLGTAEFCRVRGLVALAGLRIRRFTRAYAGRETQNSAFKQLIPRVLRPHVYIRPCSQAAALSLYYLCRACCLTSGYGVGGRTATPGAQHNGAAAEQRGHQPPRPLDNRIVERAGRGHRPPAGPSRQSSLANDSNSKRDHYGPPRWQDRNVGVLSRVGPRRVDRTMHQGRGDRFPRQRVEARA